MRQYRDLFHLETDGDEFQIYGEKGTHDYPALRLRREGDYVAISADYGPLEIALRPRYDELARMFSRLHPLESPQTTRQVGSSSAYLALGLQADGALLIRPTLVADARGYFCFNLRLSADATLALYKWLEVEPLEVSPD